MMEKIDVDNFENIGKLLVDKVNEIVEWINENELALVIIADWVTNNEKIFDKVVEQIQKQKQARGDVENEKD